MSIRLIYILSICLIFITCICYNGCGSSYSSGVGGCRKVVRVRQVLVVHLVSESQIGFAFSGFEGRDLVLVC